MINPIINVLEKGVWIGFLLITASISFVSEPFASVIWMQLGLVVYALSTIYCVLVLLGMPLNNALWTSRGRWLLLLAATSLAWLYLQTLLPFGNALSSSLGAQPDAPAWLETGNKITADVQRTRWLFFSYTPAFALLLLSASLITTRERIRQLVYLFMLLAVVHSVAAIVYKYQGQYLVDKEQLDGHWTAARGWFINRNHFAAFLITMSFASVSIFLKRSMSKESWSITLAAAVIAALILLAVIQSQSRAALICLTLVYLAALLLPGKFRLKASRRSGTSLDWRILTGLLFLTMLAFGLFGEEILQRFSQFSIGLGERELQWQITWQAILESPWYGYGGASYAAVFQHVRDYAELRQVVFDQSHNDYLHILLEQGLIGLTLWLVFLLLVFRNSFQSMRTTQSSLVASTLLAGLFILAAALLQAAVDFNLQIVSLRCYFFVIIGLMVAAPAVHQDRTNTHD